MAAGVFTIGPCGCCDGFCCPAALWPDTLTLTLSVDPLSDPACDFTCDSEAYPLTFTLRKTTYGEGCPSDVFIWEYVDFDGGGPGVCAAVWQLDREGCRLVQRAGVEAGVCSGGSNTAFLTVVSCDPFHLTGALGGSLSPFCQINVDITE